MTASVARDAAQVVARIFDEAERRDPEHQRCWVALVDGNNHQIDRINAEAENRKVKVTTVIDLIHVMEYIWGAAWCFFAGGEQSAEDWVRDKTLCVLEGNSRDVAAGIRRRATTAWFTKATCKKADACGSYLINKDPTSTTRRRWRLDGPSPRGSSRAPADTSSLIEWISLAHAGWSTMPKQFSNYARCAPTATSTTTGRSTSTTNDDECTSRATQTASSPSPRSHSYGAAPYSFGIQSIP